MTTAPDARTAPVELASALSRVDEIVRRAGERRVAVFLDYDGTLTPIVDRPDLAVLADATREVLVRLAKTCPVAIVSGRDLADVRERVGIDGLFYAGSHGFDIAGPNALRHAHPDAFDAQPSLAAAGQELARATRGLEGVLIESKRFAIAVHYRLVSDEDVPKVERAVAHVAGEHPALRRTSGKKVFELRPALEWDKGRAVLWLVKLLGDDALPIYIGDDDTDEDAFRALADRGAGIAVIEAPRETAARYRLRDPDEVREFLGALTAAIASRGSEPPAER